MAAHAVRWGAKLGYVGDRAVAARAAGVLEDRVITLGSAIVAVARRAVRRSIGRRTVRVGRCGAVAIETQGLSVTWMRIAELGNRASAGSAFARARARLAAGLAARASASATARLGVIASGATAWHRDLADDLRFERRATEER